MNKKLAVFIVSLTIAILLAGSGNAVAQDSNPLSPATPLGTAFTYQGRLVDGALPASGAYDFEFYLYDWPSGAGLVGGPIPYNDLVLTDGSFTVLLDFGASAFSGQARFLEVRVRPGSSTGAFTTLTPRQELTASPYALYSLRAPWSTLVGLPADFADGVDNDTLYSAGTGLSLSSGAFSIATAYRLPQSCAYNQVPKWNLSNWFCGDDNDTTTFWSLSGNSGTNPATQYLGTSDNQALEIRVNNTRILRLDPYPNGPNVIGGYSGNWITDTGIGNKVYSATLFGGSYNGINRVTDIGGTVSGGQDNQAGDNHGDIVDAQAATVGGGQMNTASGLTSTVGGGFHNQASGLSGTVSGGSSNNASGDYATIVGGSQNSASGYEATVAGGYGNAASGNYTSASGYRAVASQRGSFVWSDYNSTFPYDPYSYPKAGGIQNSFNLRATGGVYFVTGIDTNTGWPTNGVFLSPAGSGWISYSNPAGERNKVQVDSREILTRLAGIQISSWNYVGQDASIRHIGPMAQDFNAAFGVGEPDKVGEKSYINSSDVDGVALAAIQGLYQVVQEKDARLAELEGLVSAQQQQIDALAARLSALEGGAAPVAVQDKQAFSGFGVLGLMAAGLGYAWLAVKKGGER